MNDEMNATPDSSQQPVSIHDTPHQHHGALPFIAAMLGVFLVIETIVLVYVVTTYVAVDKAKEQVVEQRQEVIQQVKDRVKDRAEDKQDNDGLFSHLVLNGATRELTADSDSTWMNEAILADEHHHDDCQDVYMMVDDSQRQGFGVSKAGLSDPDVIAAFGDRVTNEGMTKLGAVLDDGYSLFKTCTSATEDYVILLDDSNTIATLADYNDEHDWWQLYQPVNGVADGAVSLWFDVLSEAPVLGTGYGDAGWSWWSYWVPTEYHSMQLVESCTNAPTFDANDNTVDGVRELTCEVEYVR